MNTMQESQETKKKIKNASNGWKNDIMLLLEKGLKKGEKGLAFLEKEIHKLIVKQEKMANDAKERLRATTSKVKQKLTRKEEKG